MNQNIRKSIKMTLLLLFVCILPVSADNAFEQHCVPCHTRMDISLQRTFMNALLVYGGRENMKEGLAYYLRNPHKDTSVMDEDYIRINGIKAPIKIEKSVLYEALEQYWQNYTVMKKLY